MVKKWFQIKDRIGKLYRIKISNEGRKVWNSYNNIESYKYKVTIGENNEVAIALYYDAENIILIDELSLRQYKLNRIGLGTEIINLLAKYFTNEKKRIILLVHPCDDAYDFFKKNSFKQLSLDLDRDNIEINLNQDLNEIDFKNIRRISKSYSQYFKVIEK